MASGPPVVVDGPAGTSVSWRVVAYRISPDCCKRAVTRKQ